MQVGRKKKSLRREASQQEPLHPAAGTEVSGKGGQDGVDGLHHGCS